MWRHRRALYVTALLAVVLVAGAGAVLSRIQLPSEQVPAQTSYLCAADVATECGPGNALASFSAEQDRQLARYDQIPQVLVDAVLAAEDKDFFNHPGLDPAGIVRALYHDLQGEGVLQGGSTITQQYAKTAYLSSQRTVWRKLREAVLAVKLEQHFTKEQILERYLNTIYFGRGAYGVAAATRAYFNHDLSHMQLQEAVYLAALIRSPETADVYYADSRPEATFRMKGIYANMVREGMVTQAEADAAEAVPFESYVYGRQVRSGMGQVAHAECGTKYFVDYVRQQLLADPQVGTGLYTKGLRIYTTLDYAKQCQAFTTLYGESLPDAADPAAALVSLDQQGRVVAMVGGRDYDASEVNLALGGAGGGSGRQPGSAFKPFALVAAVQSDVSLRSRFSAPDKVVIPGADDGRDWEVHNYVDATGGTTTLDLLQATEESSNTVFAQLISQIGPAKVAEVARQMGISADLPAVPALVLGTAEVSPLDMAAAYSTLANRGWRIGPQAIVRIEDAQGVLVSQPVSTSQQVLPEQAADQVTTALRGVVDDGTGVKAKIHLDAAGKTGTTEDARDAWFVGYTCNLTTAVWMGYPGTAQQPVAPMQGILGVKEVTGGSIPASMWSGYMDRVTADVPADACDLTPNSVQWSGRILNPDLGTRSSSRSGSDVAPSAVTPATTSSTAAEGSDAAAGSTSGSAQQGGSSSGGAAASDGDPDTSPPPTTPGGSGSETEPTTTTEAPSPPPPPTATPTGGTG